MGKSLAEVAATLKQFAKPGAKLDNSIAPVVRSSFERYVERFGEADEAAKAGKSLEKIAEDARAFDVTESAILAGKNIEEPVIKVLRAISVRRALIETRLWTTFSERDQLEVMSELFRRIDRQKAKALEKMASASRDASLAGYRIVARGLVREVHGRSLREIQDVVHNLQVEVINLWRREPATEIVDSVMEGPVRLPTRMVDGQRSVALGPDRLVGIGKRYPQVVEHTMADGTQGTFRVAGELEMRMLVEVKGRTTATDGLRQVLAVPRRSKGGYVVIGGEVWLLKPYDPARVTHFIVAPAGDSLRDAAAESLFLAAQGVKVKVLPINAAIENEVISVADSLVDDIGKHALSTLNSAKKGGK